MLSEKTQSILDSAENQIGEYVFFNWTRELIEALKSDEKEAIQEYMDSFLPQDAGDYYGFRGGNPEPEIHGNIEISDEELLSGDWLGVSLIYKKRKSE